MAINYFKKLSEDAKKEFVTLVKNKESAYDMILSNYLLDNIEYSASDISSRLEVQYFALNPNLKNVQTGDMNGWLQNEVNEPNEVNDKIISLVEAKDRRGIVKKFYSSFALKEIDNRSSIRYPLEDDFTESVSPFVGVSIPSKQYSDFINLIETKLGVTIKNIATEDYNSKSSQSPKFFGLFSSKTINLAEKTYRGYTYSNVEKIVKVLDELSGMMLDGKIHGFKKQTKDRMSDDMVFASRIFSVFLLARSMSYDDPQINSTVEKCLWLQFANVINRANFNASEIKAITELGATVSGNITEQMGLTKEDIIENMEQNEYAYDEEPSNVKEALLFARESNYAKYVRPIYEALHTQGNEDVTKGSPIYDNFDATMEEAQREAQELLKLVGAEPVKMLESGKFLIEGKTAEANLPNVADRAASLPINVFAKSDDELLQGLSKLLGGESTSLVTRGKATQTHKASKNIDFDKSIVKESTVEKVIDGMIIKAISDKAISIIRHVNAGNYSEYGGKAKCDEVASFLSNTSTFYQSLQTSSRQERPMSVHNYNDSQAFASKLNDLKFVLINKIMEYNKSNAKDPSVSLATYINIAYKSIFGKDQSLRESIKEIVKKTATQFNLKENSSFSDTTK